MNILAGINHLHPGARFGMDFVICCDSDGLPYIAEWHLNAPRPTAEELAAASVAAEKAQAVALNTAAIQAELDRQAFARGYDNIVSACSYAAQPEGAPFQAEGAAFLTWRSAVWTQAIATLANVEASNAPMPTPGEAVAAMPALVLP